MRNEVSDMLGVEFPIIAFSHCRDVIVSVVNAGGFGVLGATGHSPEDLDVDLSWIDEHTKGGHYGVDLLYPAKRADVLHRGQREAEPAGGAALSPGAPPVRPGHSRSLPGARAAPGFRPRP